MWLRCARRLLPSRVWSGAGTVVRKSYLDLGVGGGMVTVGRFAQGFVSGPVPLRWVVVVVDEAGKEHYIAVEQSVGEQVEVGDVVTADDPLVEVERRGLGGASGGW